MVSAGQLICLPRCLQQRHAQVRTVLMVFSSGQNPSIPEALVKEGRWEQLYTVFINTIA
jgi:hypothetical protein